jgi:hypothetical protein
MRMRGRGGISRALYVAGKGQREGGKMLPSTRTLTRLAKATGTTLHISFTPTPAMARRQPDKPPASRQRRRIA